MSSSSAFSDWSSQQSISSKQRNRESNIALKSAERAEYVNLATKQIELYCNDAKVRQEQTSRLLASIEKSTKQDSKVARLKKRLSGVEKRVKSVDKKVDKMSEDLSNLASSLNRFLNSMPPQ